MRKNINYMYNSCIPLRRPAPLDVWYVVSIVDKPQWLPMGRNKSNNFITDIINFVKPLQYPIIVSCYTIIGLWPGVVTIIGLALSVTVVKILSTLLYDY